MCVFCVSYTLPCLSDLHSFKKAANSSYWTRIRWVAMIQSGYIQIRDEFVIRISTEYFVCNPFCVEAVSKLVESKGETIVYATNVDKQHK